MKLKQLGANRTELTLLSGVIVLYSYSTPVSVYVPGLGYLRTDKSYSRTTAKHITQWLDNAPADKISQADINQYAGGGFYLTP